MQFSAADELEWIVVDNDSKDNSKEIITKQFPFVQWIDMGYNAGFARANNRGIQHSMGDAVLLLNPDTLIENDALQKCFEKFSSTNHVACGVQLLNVDGSPQISGSYFMAGGLNYLLPLPYVGNALKFLGDSLKVKKPHVPNAKDTVEVDWINGAFLMVKKSAIAKAGLLDEDFFLYAEEVEWCYRLKKVGSLFIYGELNVVHLQGETANTTFGSSDKGYLNLFDRKGLQLMVSNFLRIYKQFGIGWFLLQLFFYCITIPVFFLGVFFNALFFQKSPYSFSQFVGFCKNVFLLLGYCTKIIRGKPYFYKVL